MGSKLYGVAAADGRAVANGRNAAANGRIPAAAAALAKPPTATLRLSRPCFGIEARYQGCAELFNCALNCFAAAFIKGEAVQ